MPVYHQGRKVKGVYHQGRKVKELWYMGRKVYSSIMYGGYGAFIEEMAQRCKVSSLGDTSATFRSAFGSTNSQCHLVASGDAALEVRQGSRRAMFIEVRNGTVYAVVTSNRSTTVSLSAPIATGVHAITLSTADRALGYGVTLLVDGKAVGANELVGGVFSPHKVFENGDVTTSARNAVAWGAGDTEIMPFLDMASAYSGNDVSVQWIADSLKPGHVVWYSGAKITYLAQGGEAMAWAYSGGQGGQGGGNSSAGYAGADGNGLLASGFTLGMLPEVTIGTGGAGGRGAQFSSRGNPGSPGQPTTIGNWFTTANATTRPTPQAWGSTYTGELPGKGGAGGEAGSNGGEGSPGKAGMPGGLVLARRWL